MNDDDFQLNARGEWARRLGGLLIFSAALYGLSYLTPAQAVAVCILFGAALLTFLEWRRAYSAAVFIQWCKGNGFVIWLVAVLLAAALLCR
jgi:hypothetical protein